jgi:hypothetical protein
MVELFTKQILNQQPTLHKALELKREFTTTDRRSAHTNITNKAGISDKKFVFFVWLRVLFLKSRNMDQLHVDIDFFNAHSMDSNFSVMMPADKTDLNKRTRRTINKISVHAGFITNFYFSEQVPNLASGMNVFSITGEVA